jgi:uncharacterized delta-60 repeat protein
MGITSAHAAGGGLDPTFGSGGRVLTNLGVTVVPHDAALQSNGDIVVAAEIGVNFGVVRYLPNGSLDSTFGHGGVAQTSFNNFFSPANALTIQSDGKIVAAGEEQSPTGSPDEFAVARFTANGNLDPGFGTGGKVTTEFFNPPLAGAQERADAVLVQPDGKILVGGSARQGQNRFAPTMTAIARYNPNGSLDTSFGSGGKVLANGIGNVVTLGLDAAGDIFALDHNAIAELSHAGNFDSTVTPAAITASTRGGLDAFLSDGRYVVANSVIVIKNDVDTQVQRFTAAGGADPAFSGPTLDYTGQDGSSRDEAGAVAIQPNGQIVVAGSHFMSTSVFGVGRVNSTGSLDTSFGSGGVLTTTFFGDEAVTALLIQPDGKIVAIGFTENNSTGQVFLALVRYQGN